MNELGDIWGWGERESFEVIVKSEGFIEKRTLEQQRLGWTGASTRSRARTQAMEATALSQNSIQCLRRKPRAGPLSRSLLLPPYHTCVGRKGPWYKNDQGEKDQSLFLGWPLSGLSWWGGQSLELQKDLPWWAAPFPTPGVSFQFCPSSQDPPWTPRPYSIQTWGTHTDVGLHPVTRKPANFISRCIPALNTQETKTGTERL